MNLEKDLIRIDLTGGVVRCRLFSQTGCYIYIEYETE